MLRQAILLYFSFEEKSNKQDSKACNPFSVFLPVIHDSCMKNKHLLVWWLHMRKCIYRCLSSWIYELWTSTLSMKLLYAFLCMTRKSHDGWGKACRLSMGCMTTSVLVNLDVDKAFFYWLASRENRAVVSDYSYWESLMCSLPRAGSNEAVLCLQSKQYTHPQTTVIKYTVTWRVTFW